MKNVFFSVCILIFAAVSAVANSDSRDPTGPEAIDGQWQVSLFFSAEKPPSETTMELSVLADGTVEGTFYGAAITAGRAASFEGNVIFTLVTEDSSGPYLHSGTLRGEEMEGQTLSTGRDFLMPWKAQRVSKE